MNENQMNDNFKKNIELHDNFLTPKECEDIIEKYKFNPTVDRFKFPSETGDLRTSVKKGRDIRGDDGAVFGDNGLTVEKIIEKTKLLSDDYLKRHNLDHTVSTTTIRFLQHKEGTPMRQHYDEEMDYYNNQETFRLCVPLIYLNDDYEGGEIAFETVDFTYKPKAGTLILFPTSFMYPHHVNAPIGNNKYLLKFNFQVNKEEYLGLN